MKKNKYNYLKVIQQKYTGAYGWEDVSEYECNSRGMLTEMSGKFIGKREQTLLAHDLVYYKELGYPTRVIFRKELADKN